MIALRVSFRCRSLAEFAREHLGDLGPRSLFVRTRQLLAPGTRIALDLRLADSSSLLAGRGIVLFATEEERELELPAGMEIQIEEVAPECAPTLRWLLSRRARATQLRTSPRCTRRFADTLPGVGRSRPRTSVPAMPEPAAVLETGGPRYFTRETDPDLQAKLDSGPRLGYPLYLLPTDLSSATPRAHGRERALRR